MLLNSSCEKRNSNQECRKLRVLVLTNTPWNSSFGLGNTYNNLFTGLEDKIEFANIYCRPGLPDQNCPATRFFRLTDKELIASRLKGEAPGCVVSKSDRCNDCGNLAVFDLGQKKRWQILYWGRDLLWKFGGWESRKLSDFVGEFNPDLLLLPLYQLNYLCDIGLYLEDLCQVPVVCHAMDDVYGLASSSKSPLVLLNQIIKRRKLKKLVSRASVIYAISKSLCTDYSKLFGINSRLLQKGYVFDGEGIENHCVEEERNELVFLYTGNLVNQRWKSLLEIAEILEVSDVDARLDIFSPTILSEEAMGRFSRLKQTLFHGPIPPEEAIRRQKDADVLIHVEGFCEKARGDVRYSVSTKIPDYLHAGKCVLAYGPKEIASIQLLLETGAALVATSKTELASLLSPSVVSKREVAKKGEMASEYAREHFDIETTQSQLLEDFFGFCTEGR